MTLSGKQKAYLKSQAHSLSPVVQIGKYGLSDELYVQINDALEKRELIKVSLLQNATVTMEEAAQAIEQHTDAYLVQKIGRILVFYKKSSKEKNRTISSDMPR